MWDVANYWDSNFSCTKTPFYFLSTLRLESFGKKLTVFSIRSHHWLNSSYKINTINTIFNFLSMTRITAVLTKLQIGPNQLWTHSNTLLARNMASSSIEMASPSIEMASKKQEACKNRIHETCRQRGNRMATVKRKPDTQQPSDCQRPSKKAKYPKKKTGWSASWNSIYGLNVEMWTKFSLFFFVNFLLIFSDQ